MKTPEEQTEEPNGALEGTTNGVHLAPGAAPTAVSMMSEAEFDEKNTRRFALIAKHRTAGLEESETLELDRLNSLVDAYLDCKFPFSFAIFDKAKELARKDGISWDDFPE